MASELVARLREHAGSAVDHWEDWAGRSDTLLNEAADRIESLLRQLEAVAEQLEFNAIHLMAEDDKDDALATVEHARGIMSDAAAALRRSALEASNA